MKSLAAILILVSIIPCFSQEICLPFNIGNGLTFLTDDSVLVSRPTKKSDSSGKPIYQIFLHIKQEGHWSEEINVPFSTGTHTDYHPEAYGDSIVFFISRRPKTKNQDEFDYGNLWFVRYIKGQWSEPVFISEINHEGHDTYPSYTNSGNLYFNSDRSGGKGSMDIYVSRFINGHFSTPKPLIELNTSDSENDLVVDPDEQFIIFNRYSFDAKELDLFISYKQADRWSNPIPINEINQKGIFELTPTLSPDKKYFYFEINSSIHCMAIDHILKHPEQ